MSRPIKKRKYTDNTTARRTYVTPSLGKRVMPIPWADRGVRYSRSYAPATVITTSTTAEAAGVYTFQLSDLPNSADFTNLYDQYRILSVKVTLMPTYTEAEVSSVADFQGWIVLANDYDDSTANLTSQLLQYQQSKVYPLNRPIEWRVRPKAAAVVYQGGVTSAYAAHASGWIDCAYPGVIHYGVKWATAITTKVVRFAVICKFNMEFKRVR